MPNLKTYLIEDSQVIRDNLVATLEELAPVTVVGWAENVSTALAWLGQAEHQVDLVIVDLFLKGGDSGLDVLRRPPAAQHSAKFIVLTNYATPEMRRKCLTLGADAVFDKSADIEALIQYCTKLAGEEAVAV